MQNKVALVVDDSRVARMTLSKLLLARDFEVVEMPSGEEALDYLYSDKSKPSLVFMDVMMGGMDGLTATQQIKADSNLQALPVVICTGNDSEADIDKAMATGAMAVLSKPPVEEQLAEILSSVPIHDLVVEVEPQSVAIDEEALVAKVLANIEQGLLQRAQQHTREIAEDVAGKVAREQAKTETETMLPALTEQISQAASVAAEETANRVCKVVARESIATNAEQAVDRAVNEQGLSEKIMALLSNEGAAWLKRQEQQLQSDVSQKLEQKITSAIDAYLKEHLPPMIGSIVHASVQEAVKGSDDVKKDEAFSQLASRVKLLNDLVIGLGVVVLGLAIMTLI